MHPFYYAATFLTRALLVALTRWQVEGRGNVPSGVPLILASNHLNNVDPPVLSASLPRRIVFMAKEELYYGRSVSGLLARGFGAFPVRRGEVDRRALKQALRVLEQGLVLGLFPEGTRSPDGRLQEAQLGTAWIALESKALILPAAVWGTESIRRASDVLSRPRIRVRFGKPFTLPPLPAGKRSLRLAEATAIVMGEIAALLPEDYRGAYGRPGGAR